MKRHALLTLGLLVLLGALAACSGAASGAGDSVSNNSSADNSSQNNNQNNLNNTANNAHNNAVDNAANNDVNNSAPASRWRGVVVINEVIAAGDPSDQVELYNTSDDAVDLSGWQVTDTPGDAATFAALPEGTTLPAKGYLVLDINDATTGFKLGGDEAFALYDADGALVDLADWDEGASPAGGSWARLPDGAGDFQTTDAPTPGAPNALPVEEPVCGDGVCEAPEGEDTCPDDCAPPLPAWPALVINEVIAAGDPSDQVELYNPSDAPVSLEGWFVTDDPAGAPQKATLTAAAVVPARGYLVLDVNDDTLGFKLGGDEAFALYAPDGTLIDDADWDEGASPAGSSWARLPDGAGDFQTTTSPTPGAPNE